MKRSVLSKSPDDTQRLGRMLGESLRPGCVVALVGDLGTGKTCLVKGVARGFNGTPESDVTSPTFTIMQEYEGRVPLYHFDAYRLDGPEDLEVIGFEECLDESGVAVIEWADRLGRSVPKDCLVIRIDLAGENERRFNLQAGGARHREVMRAFMEKVNSRPESG